MPRRIAIIAGVVTAVLALLFIGRDAILAPHLQIESLESHCRSSFADRFAVARVVTGVDHLGVYAITDHDASAMWPSESIGVVAMFDPISIEIPISNGRTMQFHPNGAIIGDDTGTTSARSNRIVLLHIQGGGKWHGQYRWGEFHATDKERVCTWLPL